MRRAPRESLGDVVFLGTNDGRVIRYRVLSQLNTEDGKVRADPARGVPIMRSCFFAKTPPL